MVAEKNIVYDGQSYKKGEKIWDLGSFECIKVIGNQRKYQGLSKDLDKLPHYVGGGSRAICLDTGDIYFYSEKLDRWYLPGEGEYSYV